MRTTTRGSTKVAWLLTGVLSLIVGVVLLFVTKRKEARASLTRPEQEFEPPARWEKREIDPEWRPLIQTRGLKEKLDGIETQLGGSPTQEILGKLYADVRSSELSTQAADAGGEFKARHDRLRKQVYQAYIDNLRAAATVASWATTGEALAPFGTLEDVLRTLRDDAILANDVETRDLYPAMWMQVYGEINGITTRLFDEAYQNRIAWTDLLADPTGWNPGIPPASFRFTFKLGAGLTMTNEPNGATGGLAYFPKADNWRDYVIDMELKLDSGSFTFYVRIGDKMDAKECPAFTACTHEKLQMLPHGVNVLLEGGKTSKMLVSVIGRDIIVVLDGALTWLDEIQTSKSRKGEPGIAVQSGSSLTITRLKVRQLR